MQWLAHEAPTCHALRVGTPAGLFEYCLFQPVCLHVICSALQVWNLAPLLCASDEADTNVPKLLAHLTDHAGDVLIARFSPDGKQVASGGDDKTVFIYEVQVQLLLRPPQPS
jgi:hypothetical protein